LGGLPNTADRHPPANKTSRQPAATMAEALR